mmetsp:Transcript_1350/g.2165  ORF Transcript_1350/g.2165 Transcript_1350/m.2165 type:complete len:399 (-) Transcript_1350:510-1706(-)
MAEQQLRCHKSTKDHHLCKRKNLVRTLQTNHHLIAFSAFKVKFLASSSTNLTFILDLLHQSSIQIQRNNRIGESLPAAIIPIVNNDLLHTASAGHLNLPPWIRRSVGMCSRSTAPISIGIPINGAAGYTTICRSRLANSSTCSYVLDNFGLVQRTEYLYLRQRHKGPSARHINLHRLTSFAPKVDLVHDWQISTECLRSNNIASINTVQQFHYYIVQSIAATIDAIPEVHFVDLRISSKPDHPVCRVIPVGVRDSIPVVDSHRVSIECSVTVAAPSCARLADGLAYSNILRLVDKIRVGLDEEGMIARMSSTAIVRVPLVGNIAGWPAVARETNTIVIVVTESPPRSLVTSNSVGISRVQFKINVQNVIRDKPIIHHQVHDIKVFRQCCEALVVDIFV